MGLHITIKRGVPVAIGDAIVMLKEINSRNQAKIVIDGPHVNRTRERMTDEQRERADAMAKHFALPPQD